MKKHHSVDEYIRSCPPPAQRLLREMRRTIRATAPGATEAISYGIPTFKLHGNLVHFAGYGHHVGFYPGSAAVLAFKNQLTAYTTSKGTVRFPLDKPLPLPLIRRMVKFRIDATRRPFRKK